MTLSREPIDAANILALYRGEPGSARYAQPGSDNRNERGEIPMPAIAFTAFAPDGQAPVFRFRFQA